MTITMRAIDWREHGAVPSVACPRVYRIGSGYVTDQLACTHCLACDYLRGISIDVKRRRGEVACSVPNGGGKR